MTTDANSAFGANEWLVDELYEQYLQDRHSVDPAWWDFFADYVPSDPARAAALAVLDVIEDEQLCARADQVGNLLRSLLEEMRADPRLQPLIGEIRGVGAMVAMELVADGDAAKPNAALTKLLVHACAQRGLVVLACGVRSNVIRFLMPLTISDELLREGVGILREAFIEQGTLAPGA